MVACAQLTVTELPPGDPCATVQCDPTVCIGYDLYSQKCVNGECVPDQLIEQNSEQCGYTPPPPGGCSPSDFELVADEVFYCNDSPCLSDYCNQKGGEYKLTVSKTPSAAVIYGDAPGEITCQEKIATWQQGYEIRFLQCETDGKWYSVEYPVTLEATEAPSTGAGTVATFTITSIGIAALFWYLLRKEG